jgi:hypothetical protein
VAGLKLTEVCPWAKGPILLAASDAATRSGCWGVYGDAGGGQVQGGVVRFRHPDQRGPNDQTGTDGRGSGARRKASSLA